MTPVQEKGGIKFRNGGTEGKARRGHFLDFFSMMGQIPKGKFWPPVPGQATCGKGKGAGGIDG